MTEIIKANSDAELLSMIPVVAGFTASDSIVCVGFGGKRTVAAFRLDLPKRQRLADYRAVSTAVISALRRLPGVDGVAYLIYSDCTFADEHGIPWYEFERRLSRQLDRESFVIKNGFCVASDGWASYFDRDYPREGRPLDEIQPLIPVPEFGRWSRLPSVTADEQHEFLNEIVDQCSGFWPDDVVHLSNATPIETVEAALEWQGDLPAALGVALITIAQSPARRDVMSLQVAFGELVGEVVEQGNNEYLRIQAEQGGSMDDVVLREVEAGRATLDDEFTGLLMGIGRVRPDIARVERMIELLRPLIALSPAHYRPGPLCILAYLLWARGLSSPAAGYVAMALEIDPDYGMALVMHTMLANGMLPEWALPQ